MSKISMFFTIVATALLTGCMATASEHQGSLRSTQEREMTVGVVQKEIRAGMAQADVAVALGSPNIVTRDDEGRETWIYDKIATEASYSTSASNVGGGLAAGGVPGTALLLGVISGSSSRAAGAASTTQKTLTVIIKFDNKSKVESFSYHTSKF